MMIKNDEKGNFIAKEDWWDKMAICLNHISVLFLSEKYAFFTKWEPKYRDIKRFARKLTWFIVSKF